MPGRLVIEAVENPRKHRDFVELAWQINGRDPDWVPPLRMELAKLLDTKNYPFFNHGSAAFFIARRYGEPVGRIAAIENRLHLEHYKDKTGFFGLFECEDDQQAAKALFHEAAGWLKTRGLEHVRGPFNYSINDENPGVLVDGWNGPPQMLMSYNPPYYGRLVESCGFGKCKDMYAYLVSPAIVKGERFARVMNAVARRAPKLEHRQIRMDGKGFKQDVNTMLDLFNQAWAGNWGFLPVTKGEVDAIVKSLSPIVNPGLTNIVMVDGKPVAFMICVPNLNEVVIKIRNGKLFPTGIFKLLAGMRKIRGFRTMLMGVIPEYRNRGIDAVMIGRIIENGTRMHQQYCELSWVLEDNEPMNSLAEKVGSIRYRTYRIYEAKVDDLLKS
ncbi:MAG: N-acetyltransferase [Planctomycetes bacterium]|nr:N-acetyltransferase [Planctomycetota bacterium]